MVNELEFVAHWIINFTWQNKEKRYKIVNKQKLINNFQNKYVYGRALLPTQCSA